MTNYTLFIFRRDLRLKDNIGLNKISKIKNVIPIFIFTPEQVTNNKFKSDNAIQFMKESLHELDLELQKLSSELHYFYGTNISVLEVIKKKIKLDRIVFNMDYTPYAIKRDTEIEKWCQKNEIEVLKYEDYLLYPIDTLLKSDGKPYTIFTPFKNNGLKNKDKIKKVKKKTFNNLLKLNNSVNLNINIFKPEEVKNKVNDNKLVKGGRNNGLQILKNIKTFNKYGDERNTPSIPSTHLSAYIKFGCVSIREVFHKIDSKLPNSTLLDQLFWREFYYYISYYFPQVLQGKNFNPKYDNIKWTLSEVHFKKWCLGQTGYPIVDAGMRELNKTGYMHNRLRLITSNFLNRILGLDWRLGEKYYAQMLTDYDPSVNNGNWQWIASTGTDPKPYFQRLFNPMLQSQKFDSDCAYILKWIPELAEVHKKDIHNWPTNYKKYEGKNIKYFDPIVDYKEARQRSIKMYREVL